MFARVGFPVQRTNEPKSEDAPNNLYEPIPVYDKVEGFGNVAIPSVSDWLDKNPPLKWGAIASIGVLALLAAQAFKNGGQV